MPFCLCFLCLFIAYLHPLRFVYRILFAFFLHFSSPAPALAYVFRQKRSFADGERKSTSGGHHVFCGIAYDIKTRYPHGSGSPPSPYTIHHTPFSSPSWGGRVGPPI